MVSKWIYRSPCPFGVHILVEEIGINQITMQINIKLLLEVHISLAFYQAGLIFSVQSLKALTQLVPYLWFLWSWHPVLITRVFVLLLSEIVSGWISHYKVLERSYLLLLRCCWSPIPTSSSWAPDGGVEAAGAAMSQGLSSHRRDLTARGCRQVD